MKPPKLPAGLSWYRVHSLYRAQCKLDGKVVHIGYYSDPFVGYVHYLLAKRKEIRRELMTNRKLKHFFINEIVELRFTQLETRGFEAIRRYLNHKENLS
jgi:hypothetical protein